MSRAAHTVCRSRGWRRHRPRWAKPLAISKRGSNKLGATLRRCAQFIAAAEYYDFLGGSLFPPTAAPPLVVYTPVYRRRRGGDLAPVEQVGRDMQRVLGALVRPLRVLERMQNTPGQRARIVGMDRQAGLVKLYHFNQAASFGYHHRAAGRHRLERQNTKWLV